ncbi:MAG: AMIN domain-containing protein, partial [Candidatus Electrothrix sp. EH2]|nr:AMIN domain-containing protein [Candidatus Electrothrix sp. EH2]
MPHFLLINGQQSSEKRFCCCMYCFIVLFLVSTSTLGLSAEDTAPPEQTLVQGLSAVPSGKDLNISIHCSAEADYIPIEITKPPKIHIDIADAAIATGVELSLTPESYGVGVSSELISNVTPELVRVEFTLAKKYEYQLKWNGNDLVLTLQNFFQEEQTTAEKSASEAEKTDGKAADSAAPDEKGANEISMEDIDRRLPDMDNMLNAVTDTDVKNSDAGRTKDIEESGPIGDDDTISVDFYKIDLHNVFRMLR